MMLRCRNRDNDKSRVLLIVGHLLVNLLLLMTKCQLYLRDLQCDRLCRICNYYSRAHFLIANHFFINDLVRDQIFLSSINVYTSSSAGLIVSIGKMDSTADMTDGKAGRAAEVECLESSTDNHSMLYSERTL